MKILMASSEMVPFAKTGGLADVVGALPFALEKLDCQIKVILPYYLMVEQSKPAVTCIFEEIPIDIGNEKFTGNILSLHLTENVEVLFVQQHQFFYREGLYGTPEGDFPDNLKRFIFYAKMVLKYCELSNYQPDIIHGHDWQAGLIPVYLRTLPREKTFFEKTASIFTIHNVAYQGLFEARYFGLTGLPESVFSIPGIEYWGKMNLLKAGINFSNHITTVSPRYSQEIQTPEFGYGMEGILQERAHRLHGILNGVDYSVWNPATDPLIKSKYSPENMAGKAKCKLDLLAEYNLPAGLASKPLIGIISRLVTQKGFDLLAQILDNLMQRDLGMVLLGTGEKKYQDLFREMAQRFPGKVGLRLAYNDSLAHKIEAGSDIFLMPSRYEPCGLNQIYSLKYGTIPVVHATGGLEDTIELFNPATGTGNGYKFYHYSPWSFLEALDAALQLFRNPEKWQQVVQNAMQADFSWDRSAVAYKQLYGLARLEQGF